MSVYIRTITRFLDLIYRIPIACRPSNGQEGICIDIESEVAETYQRSQQDSEESKHPIKERRGRLGSEIPDDGNRCAEVHRRKGKKDW